MDPSLTVRTFADEDADDLTGLLHAAYAELGARGMNFTAVDQTPETTLKRARGGRCWIVQGGVHILGTLTMSLPPSKTVQGLTAEARVAARAWLNQVAVAPSHQGAGIASHLWMLGQEWARSVGATSVGVDTAIPAQHLVRMYGAWGFEHRDVIHWEGKTYDSAVMTRQL